MTHPVLPVVVIFILFQINDSKLRVCVLPSYFERLLLVEEGKDNAEDVDIFTAEAVRAEHFVGLCFACPDRGL